MSGNGLRAGSESEGILSTSAIHSIIDRPNRVAWLRSEDPGVLCAFVCCCLTIAHCTHVDAIISCCRHHHRRCFSCNSGSIVTVTVVVAVAPPSSPTRWVSSSQLSSSAVVAAVGQYITRDVFANHIGQRVSLSAGRPGQFALESCDPLTECVRHNCDCL